MDADPASLQHNQRQRKMQHPYELPPINTGVATNSLAAELFGTSPASPYSDRSRGDRRETKGHPEAQGMKAATTTPKAVADNQKVAPQTAPTQPDSSLEDRRSMCQSPSWEAYDRRKKDKKEKEQADKEAKAKTRRLSKAPPHTSHHTSSMSTLAPHKQCPLSGKATYPPTSSQNGLGQGQTDACMLDSALPRPRQQKERPASVLGLSTPDLTLPGDTPTPQTPRGRSRSGSFTSLFKAPFEVRRSSFDHGSDSGFIGGIKLEQHRREAHQKALNEHAIGIESDIHPAFRKERRAPSPLRFLTPRSEPKDAQKRSYPPIAIRTSGKNQALLPPETSKMPEIGVVNKWRTRVGLRSSEAKTAAKEGKAAGAREKTGLKLTKAPAAQRDEGFSKMAGGKNSSTPVISSPIMVKKIDGAADDEKVGLYAPQLDHSAHPALIDTPPGDEKPAEETSNGHESADDALNSGSETNSQPSYRTAPSSPPPPPRRSSKRKSLIAMGDPPVPSPPSHPQLGPEPQESESKTKAEESQPTQHSVKVSSPASAPVVVQPRPPAASGGSSSTPRPNRWSMSNPPSIPYDSVTPSLTNGVSSQQKRTFKEAAKAAFGKGDLSPPSMPAASSSKPTSRSRSPYSRASGLEGEGRSASTNNFHSGIGPSSKPARVLGMQDWKISQPMPASPLTHSSEDSCSEDFRSISGRDTPDTSRPQSERGVYPTFGDHDCEGKNTRHHSGYTSVLPSPAFSHVDDAHHANQPSPFELDPIQAAALKVMAAFPDVPVRRPDIDRRSNSDSNLTADKVLTLRAQHRDRSKPRPITTFTETDEDSESKSPPLRDLIMSKDESSVAAPWPATYLEAARKAAPSALAPKALKTQSLASPTMASPKQQHSPPLRPDQPSSTSELVAKAASHRHHPSVSTGTDGDPIAKMFVECCGCRYYHDMPSKLYEAMANPEGVVTLGQNMEFAGSVSMIVKCPWCKHEMSTKCCAGLAAMVYVKERLH